MYVKTNNLIASALTTAAALASTPLSAHAQAELTGDTRLACEALLCLASGTRPAECTPSLSRYFSIWSNNWSDTIQGRINFLNLCPAGRQTPQMSSLVSAIANGAGRCDPASLNQDLQVWVYQGKGSSYVYISNQLPEYCSAYITNAYTYFGDQTPKYVGQPMQGGYWVSAAQYGAAYNTWLERQRQLQLNNWDTGGGN